MVNLETCEATRNSPDIRKCAMVAALLSALIVICLELASGQSARPSAEFDAPGKTALAPAR